MTAVEWVELPPPRTLAERRWRHKLARVIEGQGHNPEAWAVLFEGESSTCYGYARDLRHGYVPGRRHELGTEGFEFRVVTLRSGGARLCARFNPEEHSADA